MLKFECPKCKKQNWIEEVIMDATLSNQIIFLEDNSLDYSSDTNSIEMYGGCIDRYQCGGCGYIIAEGINTIEELEDFLKRESKN